MHFPVALLAKGYAIVQIRLKFREFLEWSYVMCVKSATTLTADCAGIVVSFKYCISPCMVLGCLSALFRCLLPREFFICNIYFPISYTGSFYIRIPEPSSLDVFLLCPYSLNESTICAYQFFSVKFMRMGFMDIITAVFAIPIVFKHWQFAIHYCFPFSIH